MSARLPFARPTLDEETVAAVASVLRSGWITSGPQVAQFEAALSGYLGGRTVRDVDIRHGRARGGAAGLRHRPRRRGDRAGHDVRRHGQCGVARRRAAGVRRRGAGHPQHRRPDRSKRRSRRARARSCRCISPACRWTWTRCYATRATTRLRVIEDAAHAIGIAAGAAARIGSFGDLVCLQLPPEQEHDDHRRRRARDPRSGGVPADRARCAFTASSTAQTATWTSIEAGGKYNLTDVAACVGLAQLAQLDGFIRAAARNSPRVYFERLATDPPLRAAGPRRRGPSWHMFAPLLPLERLRMPGAGFHRGNERHGIGSRRALSGAAFSSRSIARWATRPAMFPNAERSRAKRRSRCLLFPTHVGG